MARVVRRFRQWQEVMQPDDLDHAAVYELDDGICIQKLAKRQWRVGYVEPLTGQPDLDRPVIMLSRGLRHAEGGVMRAEVAYWLSGDPVEQRRFLFEAWMPPRAAVIRAVELLPAAESLMRLAGGAGG